MDVDAAPDGKIYVSDTWNNRVMVLSSGGTYQTTFGTYGDQNGEFDGAYAAALDNTNNLIYVVDRNNDRVQVFNRTTQAYVTQFGSEGTANGLFRTPEDIAIDLAGQIYVVDRDNHRVQVFDFKPFICPLDRALWLGERRLQPAALPGGGRNRSKRPGVHLHQLGRQDQGLRQDRRFPGLHRQRLGQLPGDVPERAWTG